MTAEATPPPSASRQAAPTAGATGRPATNTLPSGASGAVALDNAELPCASVITRALMARKIEAREPLLTDPPFVADGEQLHIFLEVANEVEGAKWRVTWRHPASDHTFNQEIEIGVSPSWRTWLRHRIGPEQTGQWFVDVSAPGGCAAATVEFEAVSGA